MALISLSRRLRRTPFSEGVEAAGPPVPGCDRWWPLKLGAETVGRVSSATWSPDFKTNVAIGMVRMTHWDAGTELTVETPEGPRPARVRANFWA